MKDLTYGGVVFSSDASFIRASVAEILRNHPNVDHLLAVYSAKHTNLAIKTSVLNLGAAVYFVSFEDFGLPATVDLLDSLPSDRLAIVTFDLCRMLGNRLDLRLDRIQMRHPAVMRICVDPLPYIAKPWQVYFPYSLLSTKILGYGHSYAIEREWDKFKDGLRDDPCLPDLIGPILKRFTFIDRSSWRERPSFNVIQSGTLIREMYQRERDQLFESETGIKSLIRKLHASTQKMIPARTIPLDLKYLYGERNCYTMSDLPLDQFLRKEIDAVFDHTNELMRCLYD